MFITKRKANVNKFYISAIVQLIVYIIAIQIKTSNTIYNFFLQLYKNRKALKMFALLTNKFI